MDDDEITAVIECDQRRFTELAGQPGIETSYCFATTDQAPPRDIPTHS